MVKIIMYPLKRFAWFKRLNAKVTYELLAKRIPAAEWQFMNYGFIPDDNERLPELDNEKTVQQYPMQMYHYLASRVTITGKQVLEVGSGRGGGASHIARFFKPAFYTGLDLAQNAVDLANSLHATNNLKFIQGSAEEIPFADNSIDVVINVESCHAYGSVSKFLSEVKRVLKPGGHLLMVDFRGDNKMNVLRSYLFDTGMKMIEEKDISSNVIRSIEAEDDIKQARIKTLVPPRWQKLFCKFAGVVGSPFHLTLKNGTRHYYRFVMQK
ncbi:methyltransferase domain-containing protein [Fulvivirgaceae bacterium PWU4]|uniref:Methyltransferase domain-containing protein n=1 Tax=Chryseosolibacter histidini TaxID=2782349 RepID=A0AAP2DH97_9BACT|nr:class I SAM-dependent methyltransferase [Chryseosolibacter histidini]MBT1695569.1 methyltransferase domain-containing protein [Chryseosolibacter histidini]